MLSKLAHVLLAALDLWESGDTLIEWMSFDRHLEGQPAVLIQYQDAARMCLSVPPENAKVASRCRHEVKL